MRIRRALLTMLAATVALPALAVKAPGGGHDVASKGLAAKPAAARVVELDWKQLLPESERRHYSPLPPPPVHDYRGEAGPPAVQVQDFKVNKTLDGTTVRLPGFIVPLDARRDGVVSEFLLVPYFGSCIHVPPPPPNQLVYVTARRITLPSIYDAYWITGKLRLQSRTTRLGAAAYELVAEKIEPYQY
jgi:hypothetical protein